MPSRLFAPHDQALASKIARLVYCNPFEAERWELEKECLGSEYKERIPYVQPNEPLERLAPNLEGLLAKASALLGKARAKLAGSDASSWSQDDIERYTRMTHFVTYHECMERFDTIIDAMLSGRTVERIGFYAEYRDALRRYLAVADWLRPTIEEEAHYFSFYFQLRRAWVNTYGCIVGRSEEIMKLRARIWQSCFTHNMARYQRSLYDRMKDIVTLITGPSGSGKELVARAVGLSRFIPFDAKTGKFSADFHEAFFPLNLSALSPTLIESELFGHRKGAFTGALQDRRGYFEGCGSYGTVFLDEIGEADGSIQVKLLRVLQTRQFQRLGDTKQQSFVGKVMAATNRDLSAEIERGTFREDFYYRLCADRIRTPSLKELLDSDKEELECMVTYVAKKVAGPQDGPGLADEVCSYIRKRMPPGYAWPGNFRELEQCARNILIQGAYEPDTIGSSGGKDGVSQDFGRGLSANAVLSRYAQSIYKNSGSYEEVARVLRVDRRTAKRYTIGVE